MNDYRCARCGRLQFRGTDLGAACIEIKCRCKLVMEFSKEGVRVVSDAANGQPKALKGVAKSG